MNDIEWVLTDDIEHNTYLLLKRMECDIFHIKSIDHKIKDKKIEWKTIYEYINNIKDMSAVHLNYLGYIYKYGLHTNDILEKLEGFSKAIEYFKLSSQKGNYVALENLGHIYYEMKKYDETIKYYKMAQSKGSTYACMYLQNIYMKPNIKKYLIHMTGVNDMLLSNAMTLMHIATTMIEKINDYESKNNETSWSSWLLVGTDRCDNMVCSTDLRKISDKLVIHASALTKLASEIVMLNRSDKFEDFVKMMKLTQEDAIKLSEMSEEFIKLYSNKT
jgi:tetratricopeptide (TPR) repeat protein